MKRKYKIYISLSIFIIILSIIFIYINNYDKELLDNKDNVKTTDKLSGIAIMLETGYNSGEYSVSTTGTFPEKGYEFNSIKSGCENGGTLSYNEQTKKVILKSNISDKCYIYFKMTPRDIIVEINGEVSNNKIGKITCSNGESMYNQLYNRIEVSKISNGYVDCKLNFSDSTNKSNLANYIISLLGTTQGTGEVVNENGYRYEGKNPNNYVWFNNEYWRIIGVFDENTHGQSGKNLVKIIRESSLGGLAYDKNNSNNWETSSLNTLLNTIYFYAKNDVNYDYCYGYSTTITTNCNYTKKGIQPDYRKMVAKVTWHLGGRSGSDVTADTFYSTERGTTVYNGRPTTSLGYIGLMYPSDYGYSVLSSNCARTTNLNSYNSSSCAGSSWLSGKGYEWTITHNTGFSYYVEYFYYTGWIGNAQAFYSYTVRPVLYLDSTVYKIDGDGSLENPYVIGM